VDRLLLVIGAVVVAALIAAWLTRRPGATPAANTTTNIPVELVRDDFARPDAPWLVAIFTSATCSTCAGVVERAAALASDDVAVQELEVGAEPKLHERYGIDGVPTLVLADAGGEVKLAHLGPISTSELWSRVAVARDAATGGDADLS